MLPDEFNHVMIDIETLGKEAGCSVLQIAAVPFKLRDTDFENNDREQWIARNTANPFVCYPSIHEQASKGTFLDTETLAWWLRTNPVLFAQLVERGEKELGGVEQFVRMIQNTADCYVWTRGVDFDIPILAKLCNLYGFKEPWHYRRKMDVRTYLAAAFGKENPKRRIYFGTTHDAVVDCYNQIQDVQEAFNHIVLRSQ